MKAILKLGAVVFVLLVVVGYFAPGRSDDRLAGDSPACRKAHDQVTSIRKSLGEKEAQSAIGYAQLSAESNPIKDCLQAD
jgi:hypothetical protein